MPRIKLTATSVPLLKTDRTQVCVYRRSLPPIPSEACHPDRSKAATCRSVATRGLQCYSEPVVFVNVALRFRMDSPLRLIL
jgi:hypothetical protein